MKTAGLSCQSGLKKCDFFFLQMLLLQCCNRLFSLAHVTMHIFLGFLKPIVLFFFPLCGLSAQSYNAEENL